MSKPNEEIYKQYYGNFFPLASQKIINLLLENIQKDESILEVGCGSGHISFKMALEGYNISGIEIRKEVAEETQSKFSRANLNAAIYAGDILELNNKYDVIWNSGLLQCLPYDKRQTYLNHISKLANKAIFLVPERVQDVETTKNVSIGVAGCKEYCTNDIAYELYQFYNKVKVGRFYKEDIKLEFDFIYYICERRGIL